MEPLSKKLVIVLHKKRQARYSIIEVYLVPIGASKFYYHDT